MPVRRRVAFALAVLLLPVAALLQAAPAGATDPSGTLVLPPRYSDVPASVSGLTASAAGLAYLRGDLPAAQALRIRAAGDTSHHVGPVLSQTYPPQVAGGRLVGLIADPRVHGYEDVAFVDLSTGAVTRSAEAYSAFQSSALPKYLAPTDDGWLATRVSSTSHEVVHYVRQPDGTETATDVLRMPDDTDSAVYNAAVLSADAAGMLVVVGDALGSGYSKLYYVDYTGPATATLLYDYSRIANGYGYGLGDLSPGHLAFTTYGSSGWTIHRRSRNDPGADEPSTRAVDPGHYLVSLGISDDATAWVQYALDGSDHYQYHPVTALATAGAAAIELPIRVVEQSFPVVDGGDFALVAGSTPTNVGVYRLTPGSSAVGAPLDLAGAGPPLSVDASAGRVSWTVTAGGTGTQHLRDQGVDRTSGGVALRGGTRDLGTLSGGYDLTAARTATLERSGTTQYAVVRDGTTVTARFPVAPSVYGIAVSGWRLVTAQYATDPKTGNLGNGTGLLYDLRAPASTPRRVPESTALSGSHLAYLVTSGNSSSGEVDVADLDQPGLAPVVVRQAGIPAGVEADPAPRRSTLWLVGDWTAWRLPGTSTTGLPGEVAATRVSAPAPVDLTATARDELRLSRGQLAYLGDDRSVHLRDLVTGTDEVVGQAEGQLSGHAWLALDDDAVVWVAPDDTTHVRPVTVPAAVAPRSLGGPPAGTSRPRSGPGRSPRTPAAR